MAEERAPEETVSADELRRLANEIAAEVLQKTSQALLAGGREAQSGARVRAFRTGWDCTGPEFTCGDYQCINTHGCKSVFKCTIKFAGYA